MSFLIMIIRMCIIAKCVKLIIFMVEHCLKDIFMLSGSAKWYWAFHHVYVLSWGKFAHKINNLQMYYLQAPALMLRSLSGCDSSVASGP